MPSYDGPHDRFLRSQAGDNGTVRLRACIEGTSIHSNSADSPRISDHTANTRRTRDPVVFMPTNSRLFHAISFTR